MGSDLSLKTNAGNNLFALVTSSSIAIINRESKAEVLAALAEHGVTSSKIPRHFQSPLYFASEYYQESLGGPAHSAMAREARSLPFHREHLQMVRS
jgi:hypothetical protein